MFQVRSPLDTHHVAGLPLDQRTEVLAPAQKRGFALGRVARSVVNPGDAAPVAGPVIQDRLDHMRRNADVTHAGRGGAAQIVQGPRLHVAEAGVETGFAGAPSVALLAVPAEQEFAPDHARYA